MRPSRGVSCLEEETIDRARCVHVSVLLRASGVGYPGGRGCGRRLAPVRGSSAALARDRRGPVPHGSPADAAGPPVDMHRIRLSKERRRLAHAVLCSSPVPLMPLPTESWRPHSVPSFVDKSTPGPREHHGSVASQTSALPTWHTAAAPSRYQPKMTTRPQTGRLPRLCDHRTGLACALWTPSFVHPAGTPPRPLPQRSLRTDSGRAARRIVPATEISPGSASAFNSANLRISCVLTMSGAVVGADSFRSYRKRVGQRRGMTIELQTCRGRSTSLSKDEHVGARGVPAGRTVRR